MKKPITIILILCLIIGALPVYAAEDTQAERTYEDIFQKDQIIDIHIEIAEEDWQSMMENPTLEEYKSATVTVDGETVENVGVRTKGNSSLSINENNRYSLRVKFDKYVKKQYLLGLDELVLNDMFADPSYLREYLSYEALREIGSPAPLTVFSNIYINGELYGFYICIEAEDDSFLKRVFGDNDGNLYKQEMGSTLLYEEGSDYPNSELKNGDDTQKTGLKNMIQVLNEMPAGEKGGIEEVLDVDSALQYIAANTMLGNYDSYNGSMAQNYYLYEHQGKFYVIPWDYNMSFGGFMGTSTSGQTIPIDEPVYGVSMDRVPLIQNLLEVPEYKQRYYEYIEELAGYLEGFEERVAELADVIRPYVEADPTKFTTMERFEQSIVYNENEQTDEFGGMQPPNGMEGMAPPDGMENMMPPEGMENVTPPDMGQNGAFQPGTEGERPAFPDGMQPGQAGGHGGPGGGGMAQGTGNSIVTFAVNRLENVKQQLAGELPTTGNTTINQGGHPGGFPGGRPNGTPQEQSRPINVTLDGQPVTFDVAPIIESGRTLVPVRAILEALGAQLTWDANSQQVTAQKEDTTISLTIGETTAYVNGEAYQLDVPAQIRDGRTLVPVRFLSENFHLTVNWDASTNTVEITTN